MKSLMVLALGFLVLTGTPAKAQGWEMIAPLVIEQGLRFIPFPDCCPVGVCGGRVWWVIYEDGTVVANEFRKCRDYNDVYQHVLYGQGDCDWSDQYGRTICYDTPGKARQMVLAHGQIVDVQHQ